MIDGEHSLGVFSRPEGLREKREKEKREASGMQNTSRSLSAEAGAAAAPQPSNLRNQAVMLAATVSDYAQEILCALCSKQFTLT